MNSIACFASALLPSCACSVSSCLPNSGSVPISLTRSGHWLTSDSLGSWATSCQLTIKPATADLTAAQSTEPLDLPDDALAVVKLETGLDDVGEALPALAFGAAGVANLLLPQPTTTVMRSGAAINRTSFGTCMNSRYGPARNRSLLCPSGDRGRSDSSIPG